MSKPILHLNLKKKWFDMIYSGVKTVEYRENKPYWVTKFSNCNVKVKGRHYHPSDVIICFSNGYSKNRASFLIELKSIYLGQGLDVWGAISGEQYFCLSLGQILSP